MARIEVMHGPNLNMLGTREPEIYGRATLAEIDERLARLGAEMGVEVRCRQTNHEGELIDWIQQAKGEAGFIILNAGSYTHTSIGLRDALLTAGVPAIEVHLSNTQAREPFRHVSTIAAVVVGRIEGLGADGYEMALRAAVRRLGGDAS